MLKKCSPPSDPQAGSSLSKPQEYRRERESTLRQLERHASSYTTLAVELLKLFTAETKAPFVVPEVVRLQLTCRGYQNLKVREPEKLRFDPKALLSEIYLNLRAVAENGRTYSRELFENVEKITSRLRLKTNAEEGYAET